MKVGPITRSLINCLEGDTLNTQKFLSLHPMTKALENSLVDLKNKGYLVLDWGSNRIVAFQATPKLVALSKEVQ